MQYWKFKLTEVRCKLLIETDREVLIDIGDTYVRVRSSSYMNGSMLI